MQSGPIFTPYFPRLGHSLWANFGSMTKISPIVLSQSKLRSGDAGQIFVKMFQSVFLYPFTTRSIIIFDYCQTSNIRHTFVGNTIVDHSDVVGASPVGAASTTSSFSTQHLVSICCTKTTAKRDTKHLSFEIWCTLYWRIYSIPNVPITSTPDIFL